MSPVVVNGRFLHQRITGVQRYAREVTQRLGQRAALISPLARLRGPAAHLWEQVVLPCRVRDQLLWSPCNSGPVAIERQVVTVHDCAFADHPGHYSPSYLRWYGWMTPRLLRRARRIITVSEFSRQRLCRYARVPASQIAVVPNGVKLLDEPISAEQLAAARGRLGLPERYLLCVSSLEPRKNLARLLEAWSDLNLRDGTSLVIVGAKTPVHRDVSLTHASDSVIMAGYVADDDLRMMYAAATAFLFPSTYEGFGLPVLEAMAAGTPVACSNTTALPEVAGGAALLFDPLDVAAMSGAIASLLQDHELRDDLRRRGYERAKQMSWDRTAEGVWQVLAQVQ